MTEAAHVFCEALSLESIRKAKEAFQQGDLKAKLRKYHRRNTECAFWGWNGAWLHEDFVHWNLEEYLPHIRVPMLAIQGEDDRYGTRAQVDAIARQAGAGADVLMLRNCGHSPHREQEEATFEAMSRYIRKIVGR
jgi:pimeloyl-ACP methyl ester carboxylesterase